MVFSEEISKEIETLAGTGYSIKQIALYLDVSFVALQDEYNDPGSAFRHLYDRGILLKHAERDLALSTSAKAGSVTAVQILEKRMEERRLQQFKEKLLNGEL